MGGGGGGGNKQNILNLSTNFICHFEFNYNIFDCHFIDLLQIRLSSIELHEFS